MLRAEHLFPDRQRALEERSSRREVTMVVKQEGEVVEACCLYHPCDGSLTLFPDNKLRR
jgi:hypothetical protein